MERVIRVSRRAALPKVPSQRGMPQTPAVTSVAAEKLENDIAFQLESISKLSSQRDAIQAKAKELDDQIKDKINQVSKMMAEEGAPKRVVRLGWITCWESSPIRMSRVPDVAKVIKKLGQAKFTKIASVTIKGLEKFLTPDEVDAVCTVTPAGESAPAIVVHKVSDK